jgi:hypothetical protein
MKTFRENENHSRLTFYVSNGLPPAEHLENTLLYYVITREEIQRCDTTRFMKNFGPGISAARARNLMGSVMFVVDGYDEIDLHLYRIPEVCQYYSAIHRQWPGWLFFSDLSDGTLQIIVACVMNHAMGGSFDPTDNEAFKRGVLDCILKGIPVLNQLVARAGFDECAGKQRFESVAEYFKKRGSASEDLPQSPD